jgi:hypothetical protein
MLPVHSYLNYQANEFQDYYQEEFLTGFNHGPCTKGSTDPQIVQQVITRLNERVSPAASCISFDANRIEENLTGGSCSSIALSIIRSYFDYLKTPGDHTEQNKREALINIVTKLTADSTSKSKTASHARNKTRSIQTAFNTITVNRAYNIDGVTQEKIKALASYYDLAVCHSTDSVLVNDDFSEKHFNDSLRALSDGIYLVRVIQKEDNHKLEHHGHSTIWFKFSDNQQVYFDTQIGLYRISQTSEKMHVILHALQSAKNRFQIDELSFHQLTDDSST